MKVRHFKELGNKILGRGKKRSWRAVFGIGPKVMVRSWNLLLENPSEEFQAALQGKPPNPEHFLWALIFMKVYGNETTNARIAGNVCEDTFRKWSLLYAREIGSLFDEVI